MDRHRRVRRNRSMRLHKTYAHNGRREGLTISKLFYKILNNTSSTSASFLYMPPPRPPISLLHHHHLRRSPNLFAAGTHRVLIAALAFLLFHRTRTHPYRREQFALAGDNQRRSHSVRVTLARNRAVRESYTSRPVLRRHFYARLPSTHGC